MEQTIVEFKQKLFPNRMNVVLFLWTKVLFVLMLSVNLDKVKDHSIELTVHTYLMCPPLSFDHRNIKINNIDKPSLHTCLFIGEQLGYRLYGLRN